MTTQSRRLRIAAGVLALTMVAVACGGDDDDAAATDAPAAETEATAEETPAPTEPPAEETPAPTEESTEETSAPAADVEGEVVVSGSSTVEPISSSVAEAFSAANPKVAISVDGPGTGDGFQLFCAGETDISDASRPIKDEEAQACAEAGIDYVELAVAIDGLTVATNPDNGAVECLDVPALYALIGPESQGFGNWSDAAELGAEVGSALTFPDAPLDIFGPGEESGTYDTFVEFAIADLAEERGQGEFTRPDYNSSPNDNVIVEGIEGSATSLGWVGFAYYQEQGDKMKGLAIDTGEGCVLPTPETVADGSYPFSRTLYIYVSKASMAEPAVKAYVDYYLSDEGIAAVTEVGYVQLPTDVLGATRDAWANA